MYTNFFKFSEKPFELTPDPKFLFFSPYLREVFATLLYGISERRGFIILLGEPGTGKTTLLNYCIDRLDASVKVAFLFNMSLSFNELLHMVLVDLGVATIDEKISKSSVTVQSAGIGTSSSCHSNVPCGERAAICRRTDKTAPPPGRGMSRGVPLTSISKVQRGSEGATSWLSWL